MGSYTTNNMFYKPGLGAAGRAELALWEAKLEEADALLAQFPGAGYVAAGGVYATPSAATWAAVKTAVTDAGATPTYLAIPAATYEPDENYTFPTNVHVWLLPGAYLNPAVTRIITFNGEFSAGNYRCLGGAGSFAFHPATQVNVIWFTSSGTGLDNDANAYLGASGQGGIGEAIARTTRSHVYLVPNAHYKVTAGITVTKGGVTLWNPRTGWSNRNYQAGFNCAEVRFVPTEAGTLFHFDNSGDASTCVQGGLHGLYLSTADTYTNTAIKITDWRDHFMLEKLEVRDDWNIGLHLLGRERMQFKSCYFMAAFPLQISGNPNSTIDADWFNFHDVVFRCTASAGTSAPITIDSGVNLTNCKWTEVHLMGGAYAVYWNDTTSSQISANFVMRDIKIEGADDIGWSFYIKHNYGLYGLYIENFSDSTHEGGCCYLRKVWGGRLSGRYAGAGTVKDFDYVTIEDNLMHSDDLTETYGSRCTEAFAIRGRFDGANLGFPWKYFVDPNNASHNHLGINILGMRVYSASTSVADNGTMDVPGYYLTTGHAFVLAMTSGDEDAMVWGLWAVSNEMTTGESVLMAGTAAKTSGAYNTDTMLNCYRSAANSTFRLQNMLGDTRTITVMVFAR